MENIGTEEFVYWMLTVISYCSSLFWRSETLMRKKGYLFINIYWFGLAFLWNGLHPIILPALLIRMVPESLKNTYLGGLTFIGLILAMVIQPLAGAFSDQTRTRWGKRRPWILAGTLASTVFLIGMALTGSLWGVVATYLFLQIASNTAQGPAQGLIPDLVPDDRRGLASGVKNLFDMGGLVATSLIAGHLMGDDNSVLALLIIGGVLVLSALITILTTREKPAPSQSEYTPGFNLGGLFRWETHRYPEYTRLLFSRFLILLGIYTVQGFGQYFIRDRLGAPNPVEVTGNLMATIGITITLLVFPAGMLSDRFGRRRMNIFAGGLAALGIFLLILVNNIPSLYIVGGVIGMATGIFLSVNWALATDLIPLEEAGKYMGLSNLATAGAGATSRLAGPFIDGLNALKPGLYLGYPSLFILASISTLAGTLLLRKIHKN
jgi:Na+/melibiose symporter-like transporter